MKQAVRAQVIIKRNTRMKTISMALRARTVLGLGSAILGEEMFSKTNSFSGLSVILYFVPGLGVTLISNSGGTWKGVS